MSTPTPTVYQRIMQAAKRGAGLRLSADDVWQLTQDDAIETRAERDSLNQSGTPDGDIY